MPIDRRVDKERPEIERRRAFIRLTASSDRDCELAGIYFRSNKLVRSIREFEATVCNGIRGSAGGFSGLWDSLRKLSKPAAGEDEAMPPTTSPV